MPGGKSYLGQLFSDAGADYVLSGDDSSGSVPLSFEQAYQYAVDADIWLIKNARTGGLSYEILKREQPSCTKFAPWKKRTVYFCNTLTNDYYERIPYHPEILLRELAHIFHPDCFTDTLTSPYFLPLK
jgi:iron complex transport system substrate-binding protein